jgi:hypothetical protein
MLGRLFNLASGQSLDATALRPDDAAYAVSTLDSVQEDAHTRGLLFPDAQILQDHRHDQVFPFTSGANLSSVQIENIFDYDGDLELEAHDVRVVIMQDALASATASVLYDSQGVPAAPTNASTMLERASNTIGSNFDERRAPVPPRKSSLGHSNRPLVIQPDNPNLRPSGHDRRVSLEVRSQSNETESQRSWREYRDELTTLAGCIFGNSELMAYKGTSTKVHIIPGDTRAGDYSASYMGDGRGSTGRSGLRPSRLGQSYSSDSTAALRASAQSLSARRDRRKILITRLFPVTIPTDEDAITSPSAALLEEGTAFPFPIPADDSKSRHKKPQLKQKRTPMYAVALIVDLPQASSHLGSSSVNPVNCRERGSHQEQESVASSFGSARRAGWTMVGDVVAPEPVDTPYPGDLEGRMEAVTQRWDVIIRTLTHLQSITATKLFTLLKQADMASPGPVMASNSVRAARAPSFSGRRTEDSVPLKPPKSNAKLLSLLPNSLMDDAQIRSAAQEARVRITNGLQVMQVISGQNRWGVWREEARWLARWLRDRDHGSFLVQILSSFLSTHVEWLQALSPAPYRKQFLVQQRVKEEEDTAIRARTVVVAADKMAARRLLFLLSAFLPAATQSHSIRAHRPSTSASFVAFSNSPPTFQVPVLREEPLRRRINRRTAPQRASHSRDASMQGQDQAVQGLGVIPHEHLRHARRPSDASSVRSIRTADLPLPSNEVTVRKSSAATTATITPETSIAHFTMAYRTASFGQPRPGSSGSTVADDLKRSLSRSDSISQLSPVSTESRQSSRWGSVISGFLNPRRRDSTPTSTGSKPTAISPSAGGGVRSKDQSLAKARTGSSGSPRIKQLKGSTVQKLDRDVPSRVISPQLQEASSSVNMDAVTPHGRQFRVLSEAPQASIRTSVNEKDGVIDVDVPLMDYMASFESAVSSPSSSGYLSTPGLGSGLESFEQSSRVSVDGDPPVNVAGWLPHFHPDFVLQAIPQQADLLGAVKEALRQEVTPGLGRHHLLAERHVGRWMDIGTADIIDATTCEISRVRYRRLLRPKAASSSGNSAEMSSSANTYSSVLLTPAISPFEMQVEEDFQIDRVESADDVLTEAVEKLLAYNSADIGRDSSINESHLPSKQRLMADKASGAAEDGVGADVSLNPVAGGLFEVPNVRCREVILTALEEIARIVAEESIPEPAQPQKQDLGVFSRDSRGRNDKDTGAGLAAQGLSLRDAVRDWMRALQSGA